MYAKHIEVLNAVLNGFITPSRAESDALNAAIKLMHAAETQAEMAKQHCMHHVALNELCIQCKFPPKDVVAEREHVAREICIARHDTDSGFTALSTTAVEALVLRERAAARAEGIQLERDAFASYQEHPDSSTLALIQAQLSAAQAEVVRLCAELSTEIANWRSAEAKSLGSQYAYSKVAEQRDALSTKLTERDVEIERLRAELLSLRTAAGRLCAALAADTDNDCSHEVFEAHLRLKRYCHSLRLQRDG